MDFLYQKKVETKEVELLYHLFAVGVTATTINSSIITILLWNMGERFFLISWLSLQLAFAIVRILILNILNNAQKPASMQVRKNTYVACLIGSGILWGSSAFFGFFYNSFVHRTLVAIVLGGMCAGAAATYSALRSAYFGYVIPALVPQIIIFLISGTPAFIALGGMLLIFLILISFSAETNHRIISSNYQLLFKNEELISSLRMSNTTAQEEIVRRKDVEVQLKKAQSNLEQKIHARTNDLLKSNEKLQTEVIKRETAEKALRDSEIYYRTIVETAQEGIWVIDHNHRISYVNEKMAQMIGYSVQQLRGKDACEFLDTVQQQYHNSDRRIRGIRQKMLRRRDGTSLQVIEAESLLYSDGSKPGTLRLGMVTDITDRQNWERKILELNSRLQESNSELSEFSHSVSHDLQTPLRTIKAFSELLLEDYRGKLNATGTQYIQTITKSSDRMSQIIQDLLTLSRVSTTELKHEKVNLSVIARDILGDLEKREPGRVVSIVIESSMEASCDSGLIRIVLENLLNNAWKFTRKKERAEISFGFTISNLQNIYFVKDNGAGFNMKYKEKLFKPFQRLHSTAEFPGTGIGLATVHRIIEKHNGKVWAESEVGKGAVFYFTLGNS